MNRRFYEGMVLSLILIISIVAGCSADGKEKRTNTKVSNGAEDKDWINNFKKAHMGVQETCLLYADEEKAIIYDIPGLIIYDIKNRKITQTIDFSEIGVKYLQGSEAYSVYITSEADYILFEQAEQRNRCVYDIKQGTLNKNTKEIEKLFVPSNYYNSYLDTISLPDNAPSVVGQGVELSDDKYIYLSNQSSDDKLEGLEIVILTGDKMSVIPVFE